MGFALYMLDRSDGMATVVYPANSACPTAAVSDFTPFSELFFSLYEFFCLTSLFFLLDFYILGDS